MNIFSKFRNNLERGNSFVPEFSGEIFHFPCTAFLENPDFPSKFYKNFVRIWQHEHPASVVLERSEQQDMLPKGSRVWGFLGGKKRVCTDILFSSCGNFLNFENLEEWNRFRGNLPFSLHCFSGKNQISLSIFCTILPRFHWVVTSSHKKCTSLYEVYYFDNLNMYLAAGEGKFAWSSLTLSQCCSRWAAWSHSTSHTLWTLLAVESVLGGSLCTPGYIL